MTNQSRTVRIRLNTRLLPVMVIVLFILQLVVPFQGWVILLAGLGGVWLVGYVWARSLAHGLGLTREVRFGWAHVGDRLEERFTLQKVGWLPALWVEVFDHSTMPGYQVSTVTGVEGDAENQWRTQRECTRRGIYALGPTTLRAGDPFGVYTVTIDYAASTTLVVMPPIVELPTIQVAPGGRVGEGRQRADAFERTVNAASVRDYVSGDSLSRIHWLTSLRHDSLYVRLFDSTPAGDWWIFLDMDQHVQIGAGENSTEEHGVILAASLADRGLRSGHAVGLVMHGAELTWLPPRASEDRRPEILRALALVSPGTRPLDELLQRVKPSFRQPTSIIVITPSLDSKWIEALLPLRWAGATPTILLLDPISFGATGRSANTLVPLLANWSLAHYIIAREVLNRAGQPSEHQGRWEWRVSATGRAVPVAQPHDLSWKVLS